MHYYTHARPSCLRFKRGTQAFQRHNVCVGAMRASPVRGAGAAFSRRSCVHCWRHQAGLLRSAPTAAPLSSAPQQRPSAAPHSSASQQRLSAVPLSSASQQRPYSSAPTVAQRLPKNMYPAIQPKRSDSIYTITVLKFFPMLSAPALSTIAAYRCAGGHRAEHKRPPGQTGPRRSYPPRPTGAMP